MTKRFSDDVLGVLGLAQPKPESLITSHDFINVRDDIIWYSNVLCEGLQIIFDAITVIIWHALYIGVMLLSAKYLSAFVTVMRLHTLVPGIIIEILVEAPIVEPLIT